MEVCSWLHTLVTIPQDKSSGTHWTEDSVGLTAYLDTVANRKVPSLAANQTPVIQPIDSLGSKTCTIKQNKLQHTDRYICSTNNQVEAQC
jgi:hypothetical protein